MRKKVIALFAVIASVTMAAAPITAHADLDFSFFDDGSAGSSSTTSNSGSTKSTAHPFSNIQSNIREAQGVNKEVIGWLRVPGTNIDEPVVMNKSTYDYYLYRDWKGTKYNGITWQNWNQFPNTATYLDYRTILDDRGWKTGSSRNMVLYGHNWNNLRAPFAIGNQQGYQMFGQLPSYTDANFLMENGHIYFSTGENEGVWRIFAVGYCEVSADFFYNNPNPSKEKFEELLKEWEARSIFDIDVDVDSTDRILTLSTCTRVYGNASSGGPGENQRFVVVARLLREGESENDPIKATASQNIKQPKF